jgi:uncharacterized membrane protein YkvA (DUF1232 family)
MKNRFFDIAVAQASRLIGRNSRILLLLTRLTTKMKTVNWNAAQKDQVRDKFFTIGRMAKAFAQGRYRQVPWRTMLILLAAVVYFINPFDLIPDLIPVAGLTDDFAVLVWVYNSMGSEIERFLEWEASQATPI